MRRTLVSITVAALATWVADAAYAGLPVLLRTPGAEAVELNHGNGRAVVTGRGALLVHIGRGRLRIVDRPGGGRPALSDTCRRRAHRVSRTTLEVRGRNVGCFIWSGAGGGSWQAVMRGRNINASGQVRGSLTLDAVNTGRVGTFRIGGGALRAWPRRVRTFALLGT
jgi:hypothetical protein